MAIEIRRLGPGDEDVVRALAEDEPQTALLADERTIFLAAFESGGPVGFVFGYELLRRHGDPSILFVYEIEVADAFRGQGVGSRLLRGLAEIARERGIATGFVLTNASNDAAMRLYESFGGVRPNPDDVMWDFEWSAVS